MHYTTALPAAPGRYFIRPAGTAHQGKVVTVRPVWGPLDVLAGPDLYEVFRMADPARLAAVLDVERLEWAFIDDDISGEFNHWAPLSECHNQGHSK